MVNGIMFVMNALRGNKLIRRIDSTENQNNDCKIHIWWFSHDKFPDGDWYKTYKCINCLKFKDILFREKK